MFGRTPRLPLDHHFGLVTEAEETSYGEYVEDLRKKLEESYRMARGKMDKAQGKSKSRYDRTVRGNALEANDRVLVRKTKFEDGRHKLANKWEDKVYVVVKKLDGIPVYELRPEEGSGRSRRLHRNNILPISTKGKRAREDSESSESSLEDALPVTDGTERRQDQRSARESVGEEILQDEQESLEASDESEEEDESEDSVEEESVEDGARVEEQSREGAEQEQRDVGETTGVRRSKRKRQPPVRYRTGEYVMGFQRSQGNTQKYDLIAKMLDLLK